MRSRLRLAGLALALEAGCGHAAPVEGGATVPTSTAENDASAPLAVDEAGAAALYGKSTPDMAASSASDAAAPLSEAGGPSSSGVPNESSGPTYPAGKLRETFEKSSARFRACFEPGRKRNPKLRGRVIVKFTIGHDGKPTFAEDQGSTLEDTAVIQCVVKVVKLLRYAKPDDGSVTVIYPFIFHPTEPTFILPETAPP